MASFYSNILSTAQPSGGQRNNIFRRTLASAQAAQGAANGDINQSSDWVSIGATLGSLGAGMGTALEGISQSRAYQNRIEALKTSYQFAQSEAAREADSVNVQLRSDLFRQQLQARSNQSQIDAAVQEGREGRSARKVSQAVTANNAIRESGSYSTARQRMEDISARMSASYINTSEQIKSIYNASRPNYISSSVNSLMASIRGGMQGATAMSGFSLYF